MPVLENKIIQNDLFTVKDKPASLEKAIATSFPASSESKAKQMNGAGLRRQKSEALLQKNLQTLNDKPYIEVNSLKELEKYLKESELPVFVDFYAPWCPPCRYLGPFFEEAAKNLSDKYLFIKVNIDNAQDAAREYGITSIPTMIKFQNGNVENVMKGSQNIVDFLKELPFYSIDK